MRVDGDAGIVSGTCRIVVTAAGKDIDIRVRFTELWVKEGGRWRMVLWHATNVPLQTGEYLAVEVPQCAVNSNTFGQNPDR